MIEIRSSFLTPIKTVFDDERLLGYMAKLGDNSYIIQPHGKHMEHAKTKADALRTLTVDTDSQKQ